MYCLNSPYCESRSSHTAKNLQQHLSSQHVLRNRPSKESSASCVETDRPYFAYKWHPQASVITNHKILFAHMYCSGLLCIAFCKTFIIHERLLNLRSVYSLDHHFSAVSDCLFNIFASCSCMNYSWSMLCATLYLSIFPSYSKKCLNLSSFSLVLWLCDWSFSCLFTMYGSGGISSGSFSSMPWLCKYSCQTK